MRNAVRSGMGETPMQAHGRDARATVSRSTACLVAFTTSAMAMAGDGFMGTKASPSAGPIQTDSGGVGFMSFLQMMIALGIVLVLLKFVMPKLVTKLNKRMVTKVGSAIQIEESAAFAGGSLYIVKAKSKTLLLSASSHGVSCLADLTPPNPEPDLPTFKEMVEKEIEAPAHGFAVAWASGPRIVDPDAQLDLGSEEPGRHAGTLGELDPPHGAAAGPWELGRDAQATDAQATDAQATDAQATMVADALARLKRLAG